MTKIKQNNLKAKLKILGNSMTSRSKILIFNARPLIIFELIFKFFAQSIFIPLIWLLFTSIAKFLGYDYITNDNITTILSNPLFILTILCIILFICYFSFVDISAAIFTFECSRLKKKTTLKDICKFSFKNSFKIFSPKNIAFVPIVLFIFPLINIGTTSSIVKELQIKSILSNIIKINPFISILMIALIVLIIILIFRWMFVFQYFTLENVNFSTATKKSNNLLRGNRIKNIVSVLIVQIVIAATNWLMVFLVSNIGKFALFLFGNKSALSAIAISIIFIIFVLIYLILLGFFMPISCWRISMLFYENKKLADEPVINLKYEEPKVKKIFTKKRIVTLSITLFIIIIFISVAFYSALNGNSQINTNNKKSTITCAGQSFNNEIPDYSLASINKAKELGAKMIYQNIQITKDNRFISYRDTDIRSKENNLNTKICDVNYEDIKNIPDNNLLNILESSITSTEKTKEYIYNIAQGDESDNKPEDQINIPLLENLIERSIKTDIILILDIRSFQNDEQKLDLFLDTIRKLNSFDNIEVLSNNYNILTHIKDKCSNAKTVLYLSIAIGNLEIYKNADSLAVDGINITKEQVNEYHKANKYVIAWDIRSKDKLKQTIESDVDAVCTFLVKDSEKIINENAYPEVISIIYELLSSND